MKTLINLFALLVLLVGCQNERPKTLIESGYDEQEMEAAINRARREVDSFVSELSNLETSEQSVKAPIKQNNKVEHFWLTDVKYADGVFEGLIGNEPGIVTNVTLGQKVQVKKEEISDWMYMKGDKMYGNYTMRPLLKTMPEEEAAILRSLLAEP